MIKIAPSLLSGDFAAMGESLKLVEKGGADYIHLDVMDGMFVPNITFGPQMIKDLRKRSEAIFDVHLMVQAPERLAEDFASAGSDIITVHAEASIHLQRTLSLIRSLGIRPGVAINPATPVEAIIHVLTDVDLVLVMGVNPGFGGQKFLPSALDKMRQLKLMREQKKLSFEIEMDGGANDKTAPEIIEAGCDVLVAGSYVFSGDTAKRIKLLKEIR